MSKQITQITLRDVAFSTREGCYMGVRLPAVQKASGPAERFAFGQRGQVDEKNNVVDFEKYVVLEREWQSSFKMVEKHLEGGQFKLEGPSEFLIGDPLIERLGGKDKLYEYFNELQFEYSEERAKAYRDEMRRIERRDARAEKERKKAWKKEHGPSLESKAIAKLKRAEHGTAKAATVVVFVAGVWGYGVSPWVISKVLPKEKRESLEDFLEVNSKKRDKDFATYSGVSTVLSVVATAASLAANDMGAAYTFGALAVTSTASGVWKGIQKGVHLYQEYRRKQLVDETVRQGTCDLNR